MADGRPDPATEAFLAHRNLLFTVAYEMLGSAADAEDVLQETWLRWAGVDLSTVRDQRAYLVRITTRQALTRLRTLGRRKESYVGPWLPEPLLTTPDVAEDIELAEQRPDGDAAGARDPDADRARGVRAARGVRRALRGDRRSRRQEPRRGPPDRPPGTGPRRGARPRGVVSATETRHALEAFQRAAETGDLQGLLDILAPDVVFLGDGGGVVQAVRTPVVGAARVGRLLSIGLGRIAAEAAMRLEPAQVNGYPALVLRLDGEVDTVVALRIDDGLITGLYSVRNPEKLSHMERETTLRR